MLLGYLAFSALYLGSDRTSYRIRFSAGVSSLDGEKAAAAVLKEADDALYAAKRAGRNQTTVARA